MASVAIFIVVAISFGGCRRSGDGSSKNEVPATQVSVTNSQSVVPIANEITDRDADIIRFVLQMNDPEDDDRIYFLTPTPMDAWGEHGDWKSFSASFHKTLSLLKCRYRPADEAYLHDDQVFDKQAKKQAWMRWVSVKRWISESEVEVESGFWCGPLGGGAATVIFEKFEGRWRIKSVGSMWQS